MYFLSPASLVRVFYGVGHPLFPQGTANSSLAQPCPASTYTFLVHCGCLDTPTTKFVPTARNTYIFNIVLRQGVDGRQNWLKASSLMLSIAVHFISKMVTTPSISPKQSEWVTGSAASRPALIIRYENTCMHWWRPWQKDNETQTQQQDSLTTSNKTYALDQKRRHGLPQSGRQIFPDPPRPFILRWLRAQKRDLPSQHDQVRRCRMLSYRLRM